MDFELVEKLSDNEIDEQYDDILDGENEFTAIHKPWYCSAYSSTIGISVDRNVEQFLEYFDIDSSKKTNEGYALFYMRSSFNTSGYRFAYFYKNFVYFRASSEDHSLYSLGGAAHYDAIGYIDNGNVYYFFFSYMGMNIITFPVDRYFQAPINKDLEDINIGDLFGFVPYTGTTSPIGLGLFAFWHNGHAAASISFGFLYGPLCKNHLYGCPNAELQRTSPIYTSSHIEFFEDLNLGDVYYFKDSSNRGHVMLYVWGDFQTLYYQNFYVNNHIDDENFHTRTWYLHHNFTILSQTSANGVCQR